MTRTLLMIIALAALAVIAVPIYQARQHFARHFTPHAADETVPTGDIPVVIRTNGGWLEVATLKQDRSYNRKQDGTLLGWRIPRCQADATVSFRAYFTYRIKLAQEWPATVTKNRRFEVTVPRPVPSLPVAFDTATLRKRLDVLICTEM